MSLLNLSRPTSEDSLSSTEPKATQIDFEWQLPKDLAMKASQERMAEENHKIYSKLLKKKKIKSMKRRMTEKDFTIILALKESGKVSNKKIEDITGFGPATICRVGQTGTWEAYQKYNQEAKEKANKNYYNTAIKYSNSYDKVLYYAVVHCIKSEMKLLARRIENLQELSDDKSIKMLRECEEEYNTSLEFIKELQEYWRKDKM